MKLFDFWEALHFSQIKIALHLLIALWRAKPQIIIEEPTEESDSFFPHEEEEWIGIHHQKSMEQTERYHDYDRMGNGLVTTTELMSDNEVIFTRSQLYEHSCPDTG